MIGYYFKCLGDFKYTVHELTTETNTERYTTFYIDNNYKVNGNDFSSESLDILKGLRYESNDYTYIISKVTEDVLTGYKLNKDRILIKKANIVVSANKVPKTIPNIIRSKITHIQEILNK